MDKQVCRAAVKAMARLHEHADIVHPGNVDEATFRSFLLAEFLKQDQSWTGQTEWHHFDLHVRADGEDALLEFKFYVNRRTMALTGGKAHWKGGAGPKNEGEFRRCLTKLRECEHNVDHRYLVLVYELTDRRKGKYSFAKSYDAFSARGFANLRNIRTKDFCCRLFRVVAPARDQQDDLLELRRAKVREADAPTVPLEQVRRRLKGKKK